jgi:hypothetical protein
MEVFVSGVERKTGIPFGFLNLSRGFLDDRATVKRLVKNYQTIQDEEMGYRAAGTDQVNLEFRDLDELEHMLKTEPKVLHSIRDMNLRLMRKGGTTYSPYHCFDLAKDVLS